MDDIDILSEVLIELKKKIEDQDKTIQKLLLDKANLAGKYDYLSQKIEQLTSSQKQAEKIYSQSLKELDNLKNFSKNLNSLIDKKIDELSKKFELEKIKEKNIDIENLKEIDQKIKKLEETLKIYEKENKKLNDILNDFNKKIQDSSKQNTKNYEDLIKKERKEIEKIFDDKLRSIDNSIKERTKEIERVKDKYEKEIKFNASKFENIAKIDSLINQTMKKFEDHFIDLEKNIENIKNVLDNKEKNDENLNNEYIKRFESIENNIKIFENKNKEKNIDVDKDIENLKKKVSTLEKNLISVQNLSEETNKNLSEIIKNVKLITGKTNYVQEALNEKEKITNEKLSEIKYTLSRIDSLEHLIYQQNNYIKHLETEIQKLKQKNLEEIRKFVKSEAEPIISEINKDNDMIKQKLKQIETSFNVQVKTSNNFYDLLKHDINSLRVRTQSLEESIRNEVNQRALLEQDFNSLSAYFDKIQTKFEGLKVSLDERLKKQRDEINQLSKNILNEEKSLLQYIDSVKNEIRNYNDKSYKDIVKMIDNLSKDKSMKEQNRIEKINQLIKEFSQKNSFMDNKIETLSSYINTFNEIKSTFRKELIGEVREIVKDMDKRQKNFENKFLL
ncbi:MAG: hypothetical protein QXJ06_02655 [Candidatus Aenigmatarchaeota archaeon]